MATSEWTTKASPHFTARMAGFFWLMTAVTGSLALSSDKLVVLSDGAATAANILTHNSLFRFGIVSYLVASICYLTATVLVYHLLKPVSRNVSLVAAFFSLAGCAVAGVSFVLNLAPSVILSGAQNAAVFSTAQSQALALMFLKIRGTAFFVSHVFFGFHCLLVGWLILRSTFLPRFVGSLMVFAGLGWLTLSLGNLLAPEFGRLLFPYLLAPGAIGEITLSLWLLAKGVNEQGWLENPRV